MPLPLEGVKVLDLTNVMAGPYCSMVLGDMGAEVIKIENFPEGDTSRRFDPQVNGESYCFAVLNRNKKSLALDLKAPWHGYPLSAWTEENASEAELAVTGRYFETGEKLVGRRTTPDGKPLKG